MNAYLYKEEVDENKLEHEPNHVYNLVHVVRLGGVYNITQKSSYIVFPTQSFQGNRVNILVEN
jgi:hypothetical protein